MSTSTPRTTTKPLPEKSTATGGGDRPPVGETKTIQVDLPDQADGTTEQAAGGTGASSGSGPANGAPGAGIRPPDSGLLPDRAVPPGGTEHVPDFGILGPDADALLTAKSLSTGYAEALPDGKIPPLGGAELAAVCALAVAAGLLARTAAQRPKRRA